jgi:thiol-disulfide isomerase/thioredoxin
MPPSPTRKDLTRASAVAVLLAALAGVLVHYFDTGNNDVLRPLGTLSAFSDGRAVPDMLFIDDPVSPPPLTFEIESGASVELSNFRGKVTLVNLWATWCAPCRDELGALDRLQARLGDADFEVVAIALDDSGGGAIRDYFEAAQIRSLDVYVDPDLALLPALQVPGLPTSLLLDRDGRIVVRFYGAHSWDRRPIIDFLDRYVARSLAAGGG